MQIAVVSSCCPRNLGKRPQLGMQEKERVSWAWAWQRERKLTKRRFSPWISFVHLTADSWRLLVDYCPPSVRDYRYPKVWTMLIAWDHGWWAHVAWMYLLLDLGLVRFSLIPWRNQSWWKFSYIQFTEAFLADQKMALGCPDVPVWSKSVTQKALHFLFFLIHKQ